ncbi:Uncharacterised protein [uncultured Blautia sp.]|jgi:hypothetical protein|nr:Uncharacterised protein [uncultured Blautia sp.]
MIPFVFANQVYYITSENNILTISAEDGTVCLAGSIDEIAAYNNPLSKLALEIYCTLF